MMLGDEEHPISILFQPTLMPGGHVEVVVRAGIRPDRALCGRLTMYQAEWDVLASLLGVIGDIAGTVMGDQPRPLHEDATIWCDARPLELGMVDQ